MRKTLSPHFYAKDRFPFRVPEDRTVRLVVVEEDDATFHVPRDDLTFKIGRQ